MIDILREAGYNGPLIVLLTLGGVAACVAAARGGKRAGSVAMAFALVILACSTLAQALGQHLVNQAIAARVMQLDSRQLVELVSVGTMEASRNLLVGGAGALVVLAAGAAMSMVSARRRPAA